MSTFTVRAEPAVSPKSRLVALLLCFFLGGFGVHRFYAGKICSGIFYLCTAGIFGIGVIVDLILILTGTLTDERGLPIKNWDETTPQRMTVSPGHQQEPYRRPPPRPQARPPPSGSSTVRPPSHDAFENIKKNNKICTVCGSINELVATYCVSCGAQLE